MLIIVFTAGRKLKEEKCVQLSTTKKKEIKKIEEKYLSENYFKLYFLLILYT